MNVISSQGGTNSATGTSEDSIGGKIGKGIVVCNCVLFVYLFFSFECIVMLIDV